MKLATLAFAGVLALVACKDEPKSTRWEDAAAAVAANPAPSSSLPKTETGSFNKFFPKDGAGGYARVFTADKAGYAEAKLQMDGKDVATLAISDADAAAKAKFASATEKVGGFPVVKFGNNQSTLAGMAALANMASQKFEILSFLGDVTPKADTTQAIDAGLKLAAELVGFTLCNGLPGDSVGDFASALVNYGKEEKMRLATWLAIDCVLPLGPAFFDKITAAIQGPLESLQQNRIFQFVSSHLPGSIGDQRDTILRTVNDSRGHLETMVSQGNISQESVLAKVREYVAIADDKLDLVAASLDLATNTFEHTGIQTVTRRVVTRAYGEV